MTRCIFIYARLLSCISASCPSRTPPSYRNLALMMRSLCAEMCNISVTACARRGSGLWVTCWLLITTVTAWWHVVSSQTDGQCRKLTGARTTSTPNTVRLTCWLRLLFILFLASWTLTGWTSLSPVPTLQNPHSWPQFSCRCPSSSRPYHWASSRWFPSTAVVGAGTGWR